MSRVSIVVLVLVAVGAAVWFLGPREPVSGPTGFDPERIGADLDAYLYEQERDIPNIRRGTQKHVLWADPVGKGRTPLSVVYVHGFSASLEEIRPVPDNVARALGANVFYTRLTGHGRDGAAMAEATALDWRADMEEALEIGRRIGERVIVMGTSTGGTLAALALAEGAPNVAGVVMVSPNFEIVAEGAQMLTWPFARQFVPLVAGRERFFAPENAAHGRWWTTRYPTVAVLPMAALVKAARAAAVETIEVPALFVFADADRVVSAERTRRVAARWGGPVTLWPVDLGPEDDRVAHVVAGDILSPGQTASVTERILEWVRERDLAR
ncbi:MAG: alpha/beta hydrolase [Pseudomonadota bacterium]